MSVMIDADLVLRTMPIVAVLWTSHAAGNAAVAAADNAAGDDDYVGVGEFVIEIPASFCQQCVDGQTSGHGAETGAAGSACGCDPGQGRTSGGQWA